MLKRPFMFLLLAACNATPPTATMLQPADLSVDGVPDLTLPPPTSVDLDVAAYVPVNASYDLTVMGALEGERVWFVAGSAAGVGPCPLPLGGYCIGVVRPVGLLGSSIAGADGAATHTRDALPYVGAHHCYQGVIVRGPAGIDSALSDVVCTDFCEDVDADGDGVCDTGDMCWGDDAAGDSDRDRVCDDLDICPGGDDAADTDGDSVPDGCDVCDGGDDAADLDGDGICDFLDVCAGGDDRVDTDGDGVADACDACPLDALDDRDGDGVCDSADPCPDDNPDDTDGDGVCDSVDPCPADNPDDSDGDGVCEGADICPGFDDGLDTDGDGTPDGCDTARLCSEVATDHCTARGWYIVNDPFDGNIVCTIDGRGDGSNCDDCSTYNIYVWQDGSEERHCTGYDYSTFAGSYYSAHTPCACGDNLDWCADWEMEACEPD